MPEIVEPAFQGLRFLILLAAQNRASAFFGFLPGFLPVSDGPRRVRIIDNYASSKAEVVLLALGTTLFEEKNLVIGLVAWELCRPHFQHAEDSTIQRDCAPPCKRPCHYLPFRATSPKPLRSRCERVQKGVQDSVVRGVRA